MNYIKQLNEFYSTLDYKPLTSNAIAVYTILLQIANKAGWIDKFKVANTVLMSKCDLDMQKLIRARNVLINQGYIEYSKGKNQTEAPTYSITKLYNDIANDIANNIADNIADNIANDIADNSPNDTINKQNKTKQKNKEKINKKEYGEFKNVKLSDEEYLKIQKTFPNDYAKRIQSLDDYIQSHGKKYKDFVATLRNWARKEGYKFLEEQKNYKEINLTEEEYLKKGKKYE